MEPHKDLRTWACFSDLCACACVRARECASDYLKYNNGSPLPAVVTWCSSRINKSQLGVTFLISSRRWRPGQDFCMCVCVFCVGCCSLTNAAARRQKKKRRQWGEGAERPHHQHTSSADRQPPPPMVLCLPTMRMQANVQLTVWPTAPPPLLSLLVDTCQNKPALFFRYDSFFSFRKPFQSNNELMQEEMCVIYSKKPREEEEEEEEM